MAAVQDVVSCHSLAASGISASRYSAARFRTQDILLFATTTIGSPKTSPIREVVREMTTTASAPRLGAFREAFEKLRDSISAEDARSFEKTTLDDVWTTAREIEREQGQRQSLRNIRRIEPFLQAINKYSKVIEVLCNGTPYLPFVWVGLPPTLL